MMEKYMPSGTDRAVSPVIGVVLMVGIVVALGAVVGGAVLGLGVGVGETAPNAQFDASYDGEDTLTVTHVAGDTVDGERLTYTIDGSEESPDGDAFDGEITAGTSETFSGENDGETFEIQWTSENGETSSVLFSYDIPA